MSEDRFRVRIRVDSIFDGVLIAICVGDVVWEMVGNSSESALTNWLPQAINPGTSLPTARPLFAKLDLDSVEDIFVNDVV